MFFFNIPRNLWAFLFIFFFTTSWKIVSLIIAQQILKITCHYFVHVLLLIIRLPKVLVRAKVGVKLIFKFKGGVGWVFSWKCLTHPSLRFGLELRLGLSLSLGL